MVSYPFIYCVLCGHWYILLFQGYLLYSSSHLNNAMKWKKKKSYCHTNHATVIVYGALEASCWEFGCIVLYKHYITPSFLPSLGTECQFYYRENPLPPFIYFWKYLITFFSFDSSFLSRYCGWFRLPVLDLVIGKCYYDYKQSVIPPFPRISADDDDRFCSTTWR